MSRLLVLPIAGLVCVSAFAGEPLTQGQRDFAMSHMHATRKMFLDATANLTPAQWNFKAGPDRWSIAECAEHISAAEDFIWGVVDKLVAGPPADAETIAKTKGKDELIVKVLPDRSHKFVAPEPIQPKKLLSDPTEYVARFKASRDKHIEYVNTTQDSLLDRVMNHPAAGPLNAYQWILLISGHTERHVLQILEVKADPNYPK
ncbi:MAG TPA: DinB family protein [Bryobacteraceae bacterium]